MCEREICIYIYIYREREEGMHRWEQCVPPKNVVSCLSYITAQSLAIAAIPSHQSAGHLPPILLRVSAKYGTGPP